MTRPFKEALQVLYLTIIPRTRVGAYRWVGYSHLISNKRAWNNCFIKNNQATLLADFDLQEHPEDNLMDAISWVWYNCSNTTMAATPIKFTN